MKRIIALTVLCMALSGLASAAYADSVTILRQGLLGAGTGAIANAATGGKGDSIWQGALIGAGVNVVGGALLDVITGQPAGSVYVTQPQQVAYVSQPVQYVPVQYAQQSRYAPRYDRRKALRRLYRQNASADYRQGYYDGYNDALNGW